MICMIFYMIWVSDECQHGDAIPVSQQLAECAPEGDPRDTRHYIAAQLKKSLEIMKSSYFILSSPVSSQLLERGTYQMLMGAH